MKLIHHICTTDDLAVAQKTSSYRCDSLRTEGFIHCCLPGQLSGVIERYYSAATGLKLLHINADDLAEQPVYENTVGGDELFPHVYGEINMSAVVETTDLPGRSHQDK